MKASSTASRVLLVLLSILMLLLSATAAWGVVFDYGFRGLVPEGVTLVGHDLGGMTAAEARAVIDRTVSAPMLRPLTVAGDNKTWTLDPTGIVTIGAGTMLDDAYSPRRKSTFVHRLYCELAGRPLPADVKPVYSVDAASLGAWVGQCAAQVDRKPVDATRRVVKYALKITPAVYGAKVDRKRALVQISETLSAESALSSASRATTLPVRFKRPRVLQSAFKTAVVVSLSRCRIYLYNGAKLVKSYPCAPGQPAYPTPTGDFKVDSKLVNAPWINPGDAWAASMPAMIPPGPDNPMGVRKIGINYPGVFMHGIPPGEFGTIGTHASHECMRMFPSDVLDLFGRVKIGDPVFIRN